MILSKRAMNFRIIYFQTCNQCFEVVFFSQFRIIMRKFISTERFRKLATKCKYGVSTIDVAGIFIVQSLHMPKAAMQNLSLVQVSTCHSIIKMLHFTLNSQNTSNGKYSGPFDYVVYYKNSKDNKKNSELFNKRKINANATRNELWQFH